MLLSLLIVPSGCEKSKPGHMSIDIERKKHVLDENDTGDKIEMIITIILIMIIILITILLLIIMIIITIIIIIIIIIMIIVIIILQ